MAMRFIGLACAVLLNATFRVTAQELPQTTVAAPAPIRIGVANPLTGPRAGFGISTRFGITLAADQVNRAGGLLGRPVQIIYEDNHGLAADTPDLTTKLIEHHRVIALLGTVGSGESLAAGPVCQAAGIPFVATSSTNPKVTEVGDCVFRTCAPDPLQGELMARFARENLKGTSAAILTDVANDYSIALSNRFAAEFSRHGRVVTRATYAEEDRDFRAQLRAVRAARPDVIYVPGYFNEVAVIARQARAMGLHQALLGGDGWISNDLTELAKGAMDSAYCTNHFSVDNPEPTSRQFVESYRKRYGVEPNVLAANGYNGARLLFDAIRRAGSTDSARLRAALVATSSFPGSTGPITIGPRRDTRAAMVVLQVTGGKFRFAATIVPRNYAEELKNART